MAKSFRDHLEQLEKEGKLLRVKKEVDTCYEIAAGIRKISDTDGPALLFENIKDFPGWRVAGGVYATQKLTALALDLPMDATEESITQRYLGCDEKRVKPKFVETGPVKEVIIKGEDVDLTKLPVPTYSELDVGPYLTSGVEIGKHHKTGIQNVSIHRRQILGKNRTTILAKGFQHLGMMIKAAEEDGQGLPIATVIGAPPELAIASIVEAPEGVDETYIAGAFRGAPLELVKCETIDVEVPASAEIVIEGTIIPNERAWDGPFAEFPGNYITMLGEPRTETYVVKVTAITMRRNAIFQATLTGMPTTDNHTLLKWARTAAAYRKIGEIADIKAINYPPGSAELQTVVAINKKDDLEPKKIIDTMLTTRHGPKYIIVVDDDINVYDPADVQWAVTTRVMPSRDVIIAVGKTTTAGEPAGAGKLGIDATAPLKDRQWYQKAKVPGVDKVTYI